MAAGAEYLAVSDVKIPGIAVDVMRLPSVGGVPVAALPELEPSWASVRAMPLIARGVATLALAQRHDEDCLDVVFVEITPP